MHQEIRKTKNWKTREDRTLFSSNISLKKKAPSKTPQRHAVVTIVKAYCVTSRQCRSEEIEASADHA